MRNSNFHTTTIEFYSVSLAVFHAVLPFVFSHESDEAVSEAMRLEMGYIFSVLKRHENISDLAEF